MANAFYLAADDLGILVVDEDRNELGGAPLRSRVAEATTLSLKADGSYPASDLAGLGRSGENRPRA